MNVRLRSLVLIALVGCVPTPHAEVRLVSQGSTALAKARQWAGGDAAFQRIKALHVRGELAWSNGGRSPVEFTIARPSRYERRTGEILHVLDGSAYSGATTQSPKLRETARANIEGSFLKMSLALLLEAPASLNVSVRDLGSAIVSGRSVHEVEFKRAGDAPIILLLDAKTFQPVGMVTTQQTMYSTGVAGAEPMRITATFDNFERFGEVLLPTRMTEDYGKFSAVTSFASIKLTH